MENLQHYVIRGGIEGRERLRILSRVMRPTTTSLFDRLGIADGMACLDVGCAGGDVTMELARRVTPNGKAVGVDIDETKIALANWDLEEADIKNAAFHTRNILENPLESWAESEYDVVYARFLLTHLPDPARAVRVFHGALKPGGLVIVEDIDFSGYFTFPESPAFRRYHELYCAAVRRRGGDPDIGPRLPLLLKESGFTNVDLSVVQPVALTGEAKLINPLTMENIAGAVLQEGLATQAEIEAVTRELYAFAANPDTVAGTPRVVQSWGWRAAQ
jgi:ubiquinone/menaquinone biosynthesis C-methylase UbiE